MSEFLRMLSSRCNSSGGQRSQPLLFIQEGFVILPGLSLQYSGKNIAAVFQLPMRSQINQRFRGSFFLSCFTRLALVMTWNQLRLGVNFIPFQSSR